MNCPICESAGRPWFDFHDLSGALPKDVQFHIYRCEPCNCSYIAPMPDRDTLARAYSQSYYSFDGVAHLPDQVTPVRKWSLRDYFIPFVKRNHTEAIREELLWALDSDYEIRSVLDVGCGNGQYSVALSKIFPDATIVGQDEFLDHGTPIAAKNVSYVKSIQECIDRGMKFDAIVVRSVIEHLTEPARVFRELREVAKKDTRVFVQTPNLDGLDAKVFGKVWIGFEIPRHTIVFSKKALAIFADKTGWKMGKWRTHFMPTAWSYFLSLDYLSRHRFGKALPAKSWKFLAPPLSAAALAVSPLKRGGHIEAVFTLSS